MRKSVVLLCLASFAAPLFAQEKAGPEDDFLRLNAEVIKSTAAYKESLESLLGLYQGEVESLAREVESQTPLVAKGYLSRRELDESELQLARARAGVEETRKEIAQAESAIVEAEALTYLLKLPPLPTGEYGESGGLIRYNGGSSWSLTDAGRIEKFFIARFGRLLPVSARGQTEFHDRMKFDHSSAMDVAVHPDSAEGRALMDYLRRAGIPFVAFRSRVSGSATGAHIHIGRPSLRLAAP